ncbi:tungsten formylmethanofuran dehydrogenase subunit D [Archaeoglobus veneficus]|uniref:Tungsten formylmethanofuran dehydrogenase, subunit D (FwdD-1) n=1 Tax=Archaeoglobus veneficus (strain DSM 11195 / SNP6) TaxID=693661 RepID=F2KT91_ARCVS|nr:tungsten formylmethanofuran dehydrogenase subunit D [Archaeoglobus veneficus]AEA47121.1 tungsten formylmethanofuran dehydrogenase, subunit D (FwdD-1) [Archaeoglobus veneficus SNP6]
MLEFSKFLRVEASIVVARDVLNEGEAVALVSKEFAEKIGLKDGQVVKITKGDRYVCLKAVISQFAEGVDVVIPNGLYASQLADFQSFKRFNASVELSDEADTVNRILERSLR